MVVLVMGVSGVGKTTIGRQLASELGWPFFEGDDLHPPENVRKMASGVPLDDADREPWLQAIRGVIERHLRQNQPAVITCSALKRDYRDLLIGDDSGVLVVYLKVDRELLTARMRKRRDHFMPPSLLDSQLATLEEPRRALVLDGSRSPADLVSSIKKELRTE